MKLILAATAGPHVGTTFEVPESGSFRLGRIGKADQPFPNDQFMSGLHALIDRSGGTNQVQDLESRNGTFLNEERITAAPLNNGDRLRVGETVLDVFLLPASQPPRENPLRLTLQTALEQTAEHFYLLLDAAQGPQVRSFMKGANIPCESLYEGDSKAQLEDVAPYLLEVNKHTPEVDRLTAPSWWGKNRSLFLSSTESLRTVRQHLRRFLIVNDPEGKQLFFRFYDPRVLPPYLAGCTPEQRLIFFGPVTRYWVEDAERPFLQSLENRG